jgi:hypothetical protein
MDTRTIVEAIYNGEADDGFDAIFAAIKDRERAVASIRAATLKVGDRIRLTNLRPKYLVGATGTILERGNGKGRFVVQLDDPTTRYGAEVRASAGMLELIE